MEITYNKEVGKDGEIIYVFTLAIDQKLEFDTTIDDKFLEELRTIKISRQKLREKGIGWEGIDILLEEREKLIEEVEENPEKLEELVKKIKEKNTPPSIKKISQPRKVDVFKVGNSGDTPDFSYIIK